MKKTLYIISLVAVVIGLAGWGSKGHRKISTNISILPSGMGFLNPVWTGYLADHASDADYRKTVDPSESDRHFIDIDNYSEFLQNGRIPQTFDSIVARYGYSFVVGEGTLPWSTYATFDSLTGAFRRGDWNRSAYFAADLGHYVGDGHMPLHITANYNGQKTGQTGVHSRYETSMISRYEDQLVYQTDSARYITGDIQNYIFQYLYLNYKYVDSILIADEDASSLSGSTSSSAYYGFLWERTGTFTTGLMKRGSQTLGDLIYTAWVKAGSPVFNPNAIGELGNGSAFYAVYPNPAGGIVHFPVYSNGRGEPVTLEIFDAKGHLAEKIEGKNPAPGLNDYSLETNNLKAGIYFCRIKMGTASASRRFVVAP